MSVATFPLGAAIPADATGGYDLRMDDIDWAAYRTRLRERTGRQGFLIIGTVMFFLVKGYEKVFPPKEAGASELDVLEEIRDLLKSQRPPV